MKKRVVVAMSGGVDSSVAAALLLSEGYNVMGVSMRIWSDEDCEKESSRSCCSRDDIEDARRVAEKLKIPFYVLNFKDVFEREVIDYFCREYLKGFTPNPCIICNEKIKFGVLLRKARELEADFVATGHYCRLMYDKRRKRFRLFEGYDKKKDQSYCLFSLRQEQLSSILLPLGKYSKKKVREIAKEFNLKVSDKLDSQEICFVRNNDYRNLLQQRSKEKIKPGLIVDMEGKILGEHKGICFFTVGQRKGLGVAGSEPRYVVSIDRKRNLVVVGGEEDVKRREFIARRLNWIGIKGINGKRQKVEAKIRYGQAKTEAIVEDAGKGRVRVKFLKPQSAIAPGQAAVFYQGEEVIGGGWITKVKN
jgi:tRNA-specific 2-thiouridylase